MGINNTGKVYTVKVDGESVSFRDIMTPDVPEATRYYTVPPDMNIMNESWMLYDNTENFWKLCIKEGILYPLDIEKMVSEEIKVV